MRNLRLHFSRSQQPDFPLSGGVCWLVRGADGQIGISAAESGSGLAQLCLDRAGFWLRVCKGVQGMHVNGRPIRHMALLRAGDILHVEGTELVIQAPVARAAGRHRRQEQYDHDPRVLLRGVGGRYHGRSFTLGPARLIGRALDADIRVDVPDFAEHHASLQRQGDKVLLQGLGSARGTWVNGVLVRDAVLTVGDQIVFEPMHRFVVESPVYPEVALPVSVDDRFLDAGTRVAQGKSWELRWPWLLLAATVLATALSALLWFGGR
ncbi:MAG: FHA domain-containing protein [Xanthomonadaceae bacterium]|jgi:pSer/pThr/pTyr-binding forkhead associated (FHA) protein|nr:FHA domain-containing protein [Xanthomonadaceae bacterium]